MKVYMSYDFSFGTDYRSFTDPSWQTGFNVFIPLLSLPLGITARCLQSCEHGACEIKGPMWYISNVVCWLISLRWHNLPLISDPIMSEISPSALSLLVTLQEQLYFVSSRVSPALHSFIFNSFADEVDRTVLEEVICMQTLAKSRAAE